MKALGLASWVCFWLALAGAVTALFAHWAVDGLGTRDMGTALFFSFLAASSAVATLYAAPALALIGTATLFFQRRAGLRFVAAAAVCGLPLALLALLGR